MINKLSSDPFESCVWDKFAGRCDERRKISTLLKPDGRNKSLIISGVHGIGKTSLLKWTEHEIATLELNMKTFKNAFREHPHDDDAQRFRVYIEMMRSFESGSLIGWIKNFDSTRARNIAKIAGKIITILIGSIAPQYKMATDIVGSIIEKLPDCKSLKYSELKSTLSELMEGLGDVMVRNGSLFVILLDDVQKADIEELYILCYLLETIPPGIALIIAFDFEEQELCLSGNPSLVENSYVFLKKGLDESSIICMKGMKADDVKRFVEIRYNRFDVGDPNDKNSIANILSSEIGTPENLVAFFEELNDRDLNALNSDTSEFKEILNRSKYPAKRRYENLSKKWQSRVNILCVLPPDALVYRLVDCMMKIGNHGELLSDELNKSPLFIEIEKDRYVFSDHSLRNYAKDKLREYDLQRLNSNRDRCIKKHKDWLKNHTPLLFISIDAESRFMEGDYISALKMNKDLAKGFRERFKLGLAQRALERSIICAEKLDDRRSLAEIYDEMGQVLSDCSVLDRSNLSKSIDYFQQSRRIAEDADDMQIKAIALDHMGRTFEKMNNPVEAARHYEMAKTIAHDCGYKETEMATACEIGNLMLEDMPGNIYTPSIISNNGESRHNNRAPDAINSIVLSGKKLSIFGDIGRREGFSQYDTAAYNKDILDDFCYYGVDFAVDKFGGFAKAPKTLDLAKELATEVKAYGIEQYELFSTILEDHFGGSQRASVLAAASDITSGRSQVGLTDWYLSMLLQKEGRGRLGFFGYDLQDRGPTNVFTYQSNEGDPLDQRGANYPNYAMNVGHQGEYAGISSVTRAGRMDAFACNPLIKVTFANPGMVFDWADVRAALGKRKTVELCNMIDMTNVVHGP